jgi:hypothetical protein
MDNLLPSIETMKKWIGYWRKFKGKRVQIYLRSGFDVNYQLANPLKPLNLGGETTFKMNFSENLIGTVKEVIESPFGILLADVSVAGEKTELIENTFIPMSEITKLHIFKKEVGRVIYDK